uniref:Uncharacterized protein n=1 Tax=Oryza barthii TaxID=65489 RepID=A0A0D3GTP0_9ORYZ
MAKSTAPSTWSGEQVCHAPLLLALGRSACCSSRRWFPPLSHSSEVPSVVARRSDGSGRSSGLG